MTATFAHDCPHCDTKRVAFQIVVEWPVPGRSTARYFAAKCGHCSSGVTGRAASSNGSSSYHFSSMSGDISTNRIGVEEVWPEGKQISAPDHISENVKNFFQQAVKALQAQSWDAAAIMFRKVLDVSTKILMPTSTNLNLVKRIDLLRDKNILTPNLAEWAHEVRIEGNEAAHEEHPYSRGEAESLRMFCEYFLIYTFTLPKRIEIRRGEERKIAAQQP